MRRGLVVALAASAALLGGPALAAQYHYVKVAEIDLECPVGHGDWVAYDRTNGMVYVSMKDDGMAVIDTRTNTVAHVFKDIPNPNTMAFDADYIYETSAEGLPEGENGGNNGTGFGTVNQIVVIDKHTWQVVDRVDTKGTSPDVAGVANGQIYVAMDDNNRMEVYTTGAHPQFVASWPLYPRNINWWWLDTADFTGPDAFGISPDGREIFQSVDQYVEVVNAQTGAIERHVELPLELTSKGGTKGQLLDPQTHRLWVSTTNKKPGVFILNPDTLATIKTIPEPAGTDELSFDPGLRLFYTFGGSGFGVYDANTMEPVADVDTHVKTTHTGDIDTANHNVYVYEGDRAAVGVFKPVPGPGPNGDWEVATASNLGSKQRPAPMHRPAKPASHTTQKP